MTVALGNNIALPLSSALSYRLAFDTMGKLANYGKLGGTADPDAVIKALFAAGEQGAWYDPSDLNTMFQDSAGTTPVTAVNQPVGKILDKSGNNHHAMMAVAANRPQLVGTPETYGSELLPALGAGWTAGAGWTNLGVATSASSDLSVTISLDVGSMYELTYTVTKTSGNLYPKLTGGTDSYGSYGYSNTLKQFLRAETGNTTFAITGASFTGTVSAISLKKVLTWSAPYGLYGQRMTRMYTDANVNASLPCFMAALFHSEDDELAYGLFGVGDASANQISLIKGSTPQRILNTLWTVADGISQTACAPGEFAFPTTSFVSSMYSAGTQVLQVNENAALTVSNTWDGTEVMSNVRIHIGSPDGSGLAQGTFYGGVIRFATTSTADRRGLYKYMVQNAGHKFITAVGDSTVSLYPATVKNTPVPCLIPKTVSTITAHNGDTIAMQKSAWLATNHDNEDVVFVQVGANNLNTTDSATTVIEYLQDLINTIQASTTAMVYISTMLPERGYLMTYWGGTNGPIVYQKWIDINEAIKGNGATPITNVDGVVSSHTTTLNDGTGALLPQYDYGDGIHPTLAARQVVADAWKAKLIADGVLS